MTVYSVNHSFSHSNNQKHVEDSIVNYAWLINVFYTDTYHPTPLVSKKKQNGLLHAVIIIVIVYLLLLIGQFHLTSYLLMGDKY